MPAETYVAEMPPKPETAGGESVMYPAYRKQIISGETLEVHSARGARGYEPIRGVHLSRTSLRGNGSCVTIRPVSVHGKVLSSCAIDVPGDRKTLKALAKALLAFAQGK